MAAAGGLPQAGLELLCRKSSRQLSSWKASKPPNPVSTESVLPDARGVNPRCRGAATPSHTTSSRQRVAGDQAAGGSGCRCGRGRLTGSSHQLLGVDTRPGWVGSEPTPWFRQPRSRPLTLPCVPRVQQLEHDRCLHCFYLALVGRMVTTTGRSGGRMPGSQSRGRLGSQRHWGPVAEVTCGPPAGIPGPRGPPGGEAQGEAAGLGQRPPCTDFPCLAGPRPGGRFPHQHRAHRHHQRGDHERPSCLRTFVAV
jgi:hypothetical protein